MANGLVTYAATDANVNFEVQIIVGLCLVPFGFITKRACVVDLAI